MDTFVSDFQNCVTIALCCFKPSSLWQFLTADPGNQHTPACLPITLQMKVNAGYRMGFQETVLTSRTGSSSDGLVDTPCQLLNTLKFTMNKSISVLLSIMEVSTRRTT